MNVNVHEYVWECIHKNTSVYTVTPHTVLSLSSCIPSSGVLLLAGLYTTTLSSTLASLYGAPRVLQSIAAENVVPIIAPLAKGVRMERLV